MVIYVTTYCLSIDIDLKKEESMEGTCPTILNPDFEIECT
jgi:hypothetical protein